LDSRFITVRTKESNIGNFACDVMRYFYNTDCALMASGTIRGDVIYEPGILRIKDLLDCFPFQDPCVVIRISGKDIVSALENSFSKVPALEGRFPQVSGITVVYDPDGEPLSRVQEVTIGGEKIEYNKMYTMTTRDYMQRGKEGFEMMQGCEVLVNNEAGLLISTMLRQYFLTLKILGSWCPSYLESSKSAKAHHNSYTSQRFERLQNYHKQKGELEEDTSKFLSSDIEHPERLSFHREPSPPSPVVDDDTRQVINALRKKVARKWEKVALGRELNNEVPMNKKESALLKDMAEAKRNGLSWCKGIAPVVEGRIKTIDSKS